MKKVIVAAFSVCSFFVLCLVHAQTMYQFEVASIHPSKPGQISSTWTETKSGYHLENVRLSEIIFAAYALTSPSQVAGMPDWAKREHYDVNANFDQSYLAAKTLTNEEKAAARRQMLQSLLQSRFKLRVGSRKEVIPVLDLVVTGKGWRRSVTATPETSAVGGSNDGHLAATNKTMKDFAGLLSRSSVAEGRLVVDRTGLEKGFDWELDWDPQAGINNQTDNPPSLAPTSAKPSFTTALEEQLGLKLVPDKAMCDVLVIDHLEAPTEN